MKRILFLIVAAALLFALCACTDQKKQNEETDTTVTADAGATDEGTNGAKGTDDPEQAGSEESPDQSDDADGWSKLY